MKQISELPAPVAQERDADGRLIGLVFDSTPALAAPDRNPWLVAVDGSDNALRAVAHATRQASAMIACALHLVHVQHWMAKEAAEAELAHRALAATASARAHLDAASLPWRLHVTMGEAAERIVETAERIDCAGIVIGSHGLGTAKALLLGSVSQQVLRLSQRPLLVVH